MKIRETNIKSKSLQATALGVAALAFASTEAKALLTYDLRASAVTLGQLTDRKTVTDARIGSEVTFDLYAVVTGLDNITTNDGYQFSYFSLTSNGQVGTNTGALSGLDGNATVPTGITLNPLFNVGAVARGTPQSITADGIADIGGLNNTATTGWAKPRTNALDTSTGTAISPGFGIPVPTATSAGLEYFMGQVKLFITGVSAANTVTFNFKAPTGPLGITAIGNWRVDGVTKSTVADQAVNSIPVSISLIAVPEPSAFGMVLMGAMGIVGLRRIGVRRA